MMAFRQIHKILNLEPLYSRNKKRKIDAGETAASDKKPKPETTLDDVITADDSGKPSENEMLTEEQT